MTSAVPYRGRHSTHDEAELVEALDAAEAPPVPPDDVEHVESPAAALAAPAHSPVAPEHVRSRPHTARPGPPARLVALLADREGGPRGTQQKLAAPPRPAPPSTSAERPAQPRVAERFVSPEPSDWMAYSPPPPAAPAPVWEVPAGFVPLKPARGTSFVLKVVATLVIVASGLGWFGYHVFTQPKPKAEPIAAPAAAISYTSAEGHFRVVLPTRPIVTILNRPYGPHDLEMAVAVDPGAREVVGGLVVTPRISADRIGAFMRRVINGFARTSRISHIARSTYEGHPAITASGRTNEGAPMRILFYAYSSNRMYILMAPDPGALAALKERFRPTR